MDFLNLMSICNKKIDHKQMSLMEKLKQCKPCAIAYTEVVCDHMLRILPVGLSKLIDLMAKSDGQPICIRSYFL